jgi:hypothetical protein
VVDEQRLAVPRRRGWTSRCSQPTDLCKCARYGSDLTVRAVDCVISPPCFLSPLALLGTCCVFVCLCVVLQAARLLEEDDSLVHTRNGSGQTPLHVSFAKHKNEDAAAPSVRCAPELISNAYVFLWSLCAGHAYARLRPVQDWCQ